MNELLERATAPRREMHTSQNTRGWSWIDCNRAFAEKKHSKDVSAKELFMFLASRGILRNSFLLDYNWRALLPAVELLSESRFAVLHNADIATIEENIDLLMELKTTLRTTFNAACDGLSNHVTDTLLSKILLGAFGCTVAYNTRVCSTLAAQNMRQTFTKESILELCAFYKAHPELEQERQKIKKEDGIDYPPMRMLDIVFWTINEE